MMDPMRERDNFDALCDMPRARLGERVLFVDDERVVREVAQALLHELGYAVVVAESAEAALKILEVDAAFSLLITDLMMPGMYGIALAKVVRRRWPTLGVVCCTGYGDASDHARAEAAGILILVRKPVALEALARIVRNAIDRV